MRDVAVIGVGMIKFGRYPEKTVPELAAQAALLALKDAGVEMNQIELVASGKHRLGTALASYASNRGGCSVDSRGSQAK